MAGGRRVGSALPVVKGGAAAEGAGVVNVKSAGGVAETRADLSEVTRNPANNAAIVKRIRTATRASSFGLNTLASGLNVDILLSIGGPGGQKRA